MTEGSSEFSDSDLDMRRRRSHRSQKKQVNYCEASESDGSQGSTNRDKAKKRRRLSSSESDGESHALCLLNFLMVTVRILKLFFCVCINLVQQASALWTRTKKTERVKS